MAAQAARVLRVPQASAYDFFSAAGRGVPCAPFENRGPCTKCRGHTGGPCTKCRGHTSFGGVLHSHRLSPISTCSTSHWPRAMSSAWCHWPWLPVNVFVLHTHWIMTCILALTHREPSYFTQIKLHKNPNVSCGENSTLFIIRLELMRFESFHKFQSQRPIAPVHKNTH
jgi:hypothetical protein